MALIEKRWQVATRISPEADENLKTYPPILRQILYNRGYADAESAREFLEAKPAEITDPFTLSGMETAVERINQALDAEEQIVVYGDYDADGVTATALMMQTLRAMGSKQVKAYIPNRFDEGYGLNKEALENLKESGAKVVITVDCGIRSIAEASHAKALGLDLIISDHHSPGPELPPAYAVINPKQAGDGYPCKELAGVGVAYKLASALLSRRPTPNLNPVELLDLVAIGTIADMVPLVDENRALVRAGITQIRRPHRQGLMALIGISGLKPERITAGNVGFSLGPRLNAAGRIGSAEDAYELLLSKDVYEAGQLAQVLDNHNRERQKITSEMIERSEEMVLDADPQAKLLFIYDADFNPGVVGLAASRLVDRYYRPAIVAHQGEEYTRASCRSIPEFHITDALQECAELLDHYGGHAAAAGFTVHNRNLAALKERLKAAAQKQLADQDLQPVLNAEAEVQLKDLQVELLEQLDWLEPTGYGNQSPLFVSRGVEVKSSRTVGKDQAHLKLTVSDGWITFDAIGFRLGYWERQLPAKVDLLYAFEINEFNGRKMLQLNVRDLKASQT